MKMYKMKRITETSEFVFDSVVDNDDVIMLLNDKTNESLILPRYLRKNFSKYGKTSGKISFAVSISQENKYFIIIKEVI